MGPVLGQRARVLLRATPGWADRLRKVYSEKKQPGKLENNLENSLSGRFFSISRDIAMNCLESLRFKNYFSLV
jgi:hypothetical protein